MTWNFLVVDDDKAIADQTAEILTSDRTLEDGQVINCDICSDFNEAKKKVVGSRYDLIFLDLRDDESKIDLMGQQVLETIRSSHFTPVVFYTGHAHKVEDLATPFVKVVSKGDDDAHKLRKAVKEIFLTKLPSLMRHIQEQQRIYLWEHIDNFWKKDGAVCDEQDLAYLLSRRLSTILEGASIRKFLNGNDGGDVAHPTEVYVWPPLGDSIQSGDILRLKDRVYLVLNPVCDFAQGKVEMLVLIECIHLQDCQEYKNIYDEKNSKDMVIGKTNISALKCLIGDNRTGKKVQAERYKFLPKTVFLSDYVADFQRINTMQINDAVLEHCERIATLSSPFAESVISRFSRYYGRVGVPDLERDVLATDIINNIPINGG